MNKKLTAAFDAVKQNPTATNEQALRDLAVPKFRELYAAAQKAVRTVNRHLGPNKGTPNRATMATAIGLKDDIATFAAIGGLINEQNMTDAANRAADAIDDVATMRMTGTYDNIDILPDFYTDEEIAIRKAADAKIYLYNVTNAAIAAIDTINRHVADGTYDPNTFKIAKVIGYADTLQKLGCDLLAAKTTPKIAAMNIVTTAEQDAFTALEKAVLAIVMAKPNGYTQELNALAPYDPFPEDEELADETDEDDTAE